MIVRPWEPGDTEQLLLQPSQAYFMDQIKEMDLQPLADFGMTWTAVGETGVQGIGGLWPQWENRAIAWTLLNRDIGGDFITIHRAVQKTIIRSPFRRIEATVTVGFKPGHRWMKMLGFEPEGYMRAYLANGEDHILYARVRR